MYYVDIDSCSGCGACADTCPVGAISIRERVACIDDKTCNACGRCLDVCPADAILVLEMVPETGSVTAMEPRTTRRPAPASVTGAAVTDPGATAPSGRALVGRVLSGLLAIATLALEREGRIHGGSAGSPADRHSGPRSFDPA